MVGGLDGQRLAVAGGTVNFSVYRVPYAASDDQQFLETNTSTAGGSVYEDVASLTALASKPAAFGGKVRAAAGSTGTIVVFEYDASGNVLGQLQQAFTATGPGGWTGTWQSVAYSGGATFAPALDHVRFQMYLGTTGTNFDFDEMYLNAP